MLKKNALKRIITSSLALCIMLLLCIFPQNENISSDVIYENEITIPIYAIDNNNYIARINVIKSSKDTIDYLIDTLTEKSVSSNYLPSGFSALIPENTKLIDYTLEDGLLKLNFSKEFLNLSEDNEEKVIEAIIYTMCENIDVNKIMIFVDGSILDKLPNSQKTLPSVLDKNYGINKVYDFTSIKGTTKTTTYYIGKYENSLYYIPITKITNDEVEPVEIIIKEMKNVPIYQGNLISYLNASYELKDYEILENSVSISFNNMQIAGLLDENILEEVKYTISLSIRDTYNIEDITININ